MKKVISLLFLTFVFGLTQTAFAQHQQEFRAGQQKTFTAAKLKVKFISVLEDSRCPADVDCVWAGNAKVKVQVTNTSTGVTKMMELNTSGGATADTMGRYTVRLVGVTPARNTGKKIEPEDYRITIKVGKLTR